MEDTPKTPRMVRFGLYEADFAAGELRKNGARIKLQDRPFEILRILLERPGEIVSREDFFKRLWPADTFVDFDHSLNASINKLRQALDDDADNPRFIATSGRKGYRFIAPVGNATPLPPEVSPNPPQPALISASAGQSELAAHTESPATETGAIPPAQANKKIRYAAILVGAISLSVLGAWLVPRLRPRPALTENDFILISDFVNTTGEPIFDDTLKQALTVKLSESPFFNIEPDMKVKQQLGLMGHSSNDRVFFPIDREVCERLGAKSLVAGSIVSIGNRYEVELQAQDCLKGSVLTRQKAAAETREQVLLAMGHLIPQLRRTLGESLASIQKFDTPIEQATTTSLAALKAYTEGDKKRQQGMDAESVPFYKLAIQLDPNFAIAYVRLSSVYIDSQGHPAVEGYLRKAFENSERVSEREKLYISAHYYSDFTREVEKSINAYELWRQIYPRDWMPASNVSQLYRDVGQLDKAIEAGQAALRLNPSHIAPYNALASAYMKSGRLAEAKTVCEKAVAAKMDFVGLHRLLFDIAFIEGDQAGMQRELDWCKGKSNEEIILDRAAWAATSSGHVQIAQAQFKKARDKAIADDFKQFAVAMSLEEAQFQAELGNFMAARAAVALAYKLADLSPDRRSEAALVLARTGDSTRAKQIEQDLSKQFPLDTMLNNVELALVRSAIALNRNNPVRAIQELQSAIPYDLGDPYSLWPMYIRASAYLQLKSGKDAASEFQRILDHQAVRATSLAVPLARLGLARAYALSSDVARSRLAYEDFFARWKDADEDIPILRQAKAEYSKLKAN